MIDESTEKRIKRELKTHSKAVGIPEGAADIFITKILSAVKKNIKGKSIITEKDISLAIEREARKYNKDLAYVYKTYGKII